LDNLTHGLLAATIGMLRRRDGGLEHDTPPSPTDRAVVWASVLAGEAPDLDVLMARGPMGGLQFHRGWTHSLVAAPVIALLATGITKLIWPKARAGTVFVWSLASVLTAHLLNDWMTGWGTRLLLPFSQARLGLDWVPIVDLLYTIPLLAAALIAWKRPAKRRRVTSAVLLYLAVYTIGYRGITHGLVERAVTRQYAGQPVQQVRVAPNIINPLAWQVTVDLGDRYEMGSVYPLGEVKLTTTIAKTPEDAVIRAVRSAPELKPFFDQFAFAVISYRKVADGYEAHLGDVRYQMAGRSMSYRALLDTNLRVSQVLSGG